MKKILQNLIKNKKVLIAGLGMEGRSTLKLLRETGSWREIGIADIKPPDAETAQCIAGCAVHTGSGYLDVIDQYDIAFKSPGIVLPKDREGYKCLITSQAEIFIERYREQIIGITGTKGKSTVASLLRHVLENNAIPCVLAGNIGVPFFDVLADINDGTKIILELSCHQLEICSISPSVSLLLDIFEDHLDHYESFEKYIRAKKNIYLHQKPGDVLYCGAQAAPFAEDAPQKVVIIDAKALPAGPELLENTKLRGRHNLDNCAFAYCAAEPYGVTYDGFKAALRTFVPLPHRLEYIGTENGVDFYDDSISTTAESAISAIESIYNAATILLGGMDRGIDYTELAAYIAESRLSNVICMYESGRRIYELLAGCRERGVNAFYCDNLEKAVQTAVEVTKPGRACILSPASASYGDFKDFNERGEKFKRLVLG